MEVARATGDQTITVTNPVGAMLNPEVPGRGWGPDQGGARFTVWLGSALAQTVAVISPVTANLNPRRTGPRPCGVPSPPSNCTARDLRLRRPGGAAGAGAAAGPGTNTGFDGVELPDLTIRPDNRPRVASFLAMVCQSLAGLAPSQARREAEAILDAVLDANQTYYRHLDTLGSASPDPLVPLAEVSLLQQQRLVDMRM